MTLTLVKTGNELEIVRQSGTVRVRTGGPGLRGLGGAVGATGSSDVVGTSTTSLTIETGNKTFTIAETNRGWGVGARLRASSDADGSNFMEGVVIAYADDSLTLSVDRIGGSGTAADWTINLTGEPGMDIGIVSVENLNASLDGESDDYDILSNALNGGAKEIIIPSGALATGTTISIPSGVKLTCLGDAKIVPLSDIDVVRLHGGSLFEGTIDVSSASWNSTALLFDGASEQDADTNFRLGSGAYAKANLIGKTTGSGNGTAVGLKCDGKNATISGATQANPVVIAATGHQFETGDLVYISGVAGMTQLNGSYFTVTKIDANSFSLGVDGTGYSAYTSGGVAGFKSWLMGIHVEAEITGFDKAVHLDDGGTDSTFITCNKIKVTSTYPLQNLVMETDKTSNLGCNSNDIEIMSQSRPSAGQTEIDHVISGTGNTLRLFPIDWVGGTGGTVKAIHIVSGAKNNNVVTNVGSAYIDDSSGQTNQINNFADPRFYENNGDLYVRGAFGAGDFIVYDAANSTGLHVFRLNGTNKAIISSTGLNIYEDATHGVHLNPTTLSAVRNFTFPDADAKLTGKVAVPASASAAGVVGSWAVDSSYVYFCVAANTWMRSPIAAW